MDFLSGDGVLQQFVLVILSLIVIFFILAAIEYLYISYFTMTGSKVTLLEDTAVSTNAMITITQNPAVNGSKTMLVSDNEKSGIEFSYSFFLLVNSDTFTNNSTQLKHVFHKGYRLSYPLVGPGVFILSNKNTMRIYMNSFNNWANYVDIENIPISKWFHTAMVYRNAALEVYINGNLFKKLPFLSGDLPYQNFQNVYIFNRYNGAMPTVSAVTDVTASDSNFITSFNNQMSGSISRLNYFRYALGFAEIQSLMNEGVSKKIQSTLGISNSITPYLQDTWWTTTY